MILRFSVLMQYVRREIRQLKTVDREAFLDAMETLYRLSTKEGVRMYGDAYKVRKGTEGGHEGSCQI